MDVGDQREAVHARRMRRLYRRDRREVNGLRREVRRLRGLLESGSGHMQGSHTLTVPGTTGEGILAEPAQEIRDLRAFSDEGYGLYAASTHGSGAYCRSFGEGDGLSALSEHGTGVTAMSLGRGEGLYAQSALGNGIHAVGGAALGNGEAPRPAALFAEGGEGDGAYVTGTSGNGLVARSLGGCAVDGCSVAGTGVRASAEDPGGVALAIEGRIRLHGCAVGEVCLPAGERTLTVPAVAVSAERLILLVLLDDPGDAMRIWIAARRTAQFVIGASAPARSAIRLQYLIIN